jgi:preprotein translocase subunit SecF
MQIFSNTNFDFLRWKWPFIIASLLLIAMGIVSLVVKGGPAYGIDFRGGAEIKIRFKDQPPVEQIRSALASKIKGEISVQEITGLNQLLIGTEIADETQLNANRELIEASLREMFGSGEGKPDLNNAASDQIADLLRGPLQQAGSTASEMEIQDMIEAIKNYSASKGGIISSFDELSSLPGVTPQAIHALQATFSLGPFAVISTDVVGPKIGAELRQKAIYATLLALGGMLVYIAFRFEWIYGVAAVIAVFHDTIITIGLFSIANKEISLTVVAALLTLVGYSMNDTIVIFDRIRENLKTMRRESLTSLINLSVNQTLSRTVMTSGLTFLTALALWLFGGDVLNGFSFALVVGILVGTYSSIFVASPILVFWQDFAASRKTPSMQPASRPPAAKLEKQPAGGRKAAQR